MKPHRPHARLPTTLESNELKARALEMILILFYMEDLKEFVLKSISSTSEFRKTDLLNMIDKDSKDKPFEKARALLVSEKIINQEESDEIKKLVDYRNHIGHRVYQLTVDVGAYSDLDIIPQYDYTAVKRAQELRSKVINGMGRKFILAMSFNTLAFDAAETVYRKEIDRLKKKINKGILELNKEISEINKFIKSIPKSALEATHPNNPDNYKKNGTLSPHGIRCVCTLFDFQATPLAVSYIMRCSYNTASSWYKKWKNNEF